jgi:acetyl-CoA carboxylase carboxyltransferase component
LLGYLPQDKMEDAAFSQSGDDSLRRERALDDNIPESPDKPYDIKEVIHLIMDNGEFFEIHENYAAHMVVGFAHLGGDPVGIVANQPAVLAGDLDIDATGIEQKLSGNLL